MPHTLSTLTLDTFVVLLAKKMALPDPQTPEEGPLCSFGCYTPLKRKRTLLVCENCESTTECCLFCAKRNDVCKPCAPAVQAAKLQAALHDIAECVREDGCGFSIFDFKDELHDPEIEMRSVKVDLVMGGHHVVNEQYMDEFQSISIVSSYRGPFKDTEERLNEWGQTHEFDKDELMETLVYDSISDSIGLWSGKIKIYVYSQRLL